jgi:hypothetical protein
MIRKKTAETKICMEAVSHARPGNGKPREELFCDQLLEPLPSLGEAELVFHSDVQLFDALVPDQLPLKLVECAPAGDHVIQDYRHPLAATPLP